MASDDHEHNIPAIMDTASSLKNVVSNYNQKLAELNNLIKEIESSSAWYDQDLKTAFISTANSYCEVYKQATKNMEDFISYLEGWANNVEEIDNAYLNG